MVQNCSFRGLNPKILFYGFVLIGLFSMITLAWQFPEARAQNSSSVVFPIDSKPYGLSYEQWAIKWWKWFASIPTSINPAGDLTGANCAQSQNEPEVWFLAATFGGKADRTCIVSQDKALFFTVIGTACNAKQDKISTEEQFQNCVRGVMDGLKFANVQLDGVSIPNVEKYRITSKIFPVEFPPGAIWGAPTGPTTMASDAVYLMLKPLTKGTHILHFEGQVFNPFNPSYNQATDVTYRLTVE